MQTQKILSAIIVDDEHNAQCNLLNLLTTYCNSIRIVGTASNADDAASIINEQKPDVAFLDISMPQKNGFELLKMLHFMPSIVFVTAYEQFAMKALKAAAVDFLLKPVNPNELMIVQEKLLHLHSLLQKHNMQENYAGIIKNFVSMLHSNECIKSINLPHAQGFSVVDIEQIMYLEGENNYTTFYTPNKKHTVSKTLKEYEEILGESGFFRIHKSSIINLRYLKNYSTKNGLEAVMADHKVLPVSRRRATAFFDKVRQHL